MRAGKGGGWSDHWARRARAEGWRSRAVFKLSELDRRERLFRRGAKVADLGAAPGGWSQYALRRVSPGGRVVALDIEPMAPLKGVLALEGDLTCKAVLDRLREALDGPADAVLSDMSPRLGGNRDSDQARSLELAGAALEAALDLLAPGGVFVTKLFQGAGFEEFVAGARTRLAGVRLRTPEASRRASRETYLTGRRRMDASGL